MKKSKEMVEFIKKHCPGCKEKCEHGIVETNEFVRCVDINITENKEK